MEQHYFVYLSFCALCRKLTNHILKIPTETSVLRKIFSITVCSELSVTWGEMVICIQFKLSHDLFKKVFVFLVLILSHKSMKCSPTPCSLQD